MIARLVLAALLLCLSGLGAAFATPARIIILRHGEKATTYKLCDVGRERAEALTTTYLGRGSAKSLFAAAARSLPQSSPSPCTRSSSPRPPLRAGESRSRSTPCCPARTPMRTKAKAVQPPHARSSARRDDGPTLCGQDRGYGVGAQAHRQQEVGSIFPWKGGHAAPALEARSTSWRPGDLAERHLRLFLDRGIREPRLDVPTRFSMVKQEFDGAYADVPSNDWGAPDGLTADSQCNLKGAD